MLTKIFVTFWRLTAIVLGLLAGQAAIAQNAAPALSAADQAVLDARQAFDRSDKARLQALLPQVRGHLLEPWVGYWDMRLRLAESSPEQVRAFLARWAGSYHEDRLRNDWLLLLGQRRDWLNFQTELALYRMNDDPEVRCYALWVEHLRNRSASGARLAEDVRRLYGKGLA